MNARESRRAGTLKWLDPKRWPRSLSLALAAELAVAAGFVSWKALPLLLIYLDVGRLLPGLPFSFHFAAIVVNLALFAGLIALAKAIARIPLVRQWRRPQPSGLVISALIIGLLVYLYPLARTSLLFA